MSEKKLRYVKIELKNGKKLTTALSTASDDEALAIAKKAFGTKASRIELEMEVVKALTNEYPTNFGPDTLWIKAGVDIPSKYGCKHQSGDKIICEIVDMNEGYVAVIANRCGSDDQVITFVEIDDVKAYHVGGADEGWISLEGGTYL